MKKLLFLLLLPNVLASGAFTVKLAPVDSRAIAKALYEARPAMMTYEVSRFIAKNAALSGTALTVKEVTALNYLVRNLKMNGYWPSAGYIYPFVGSDAIAQSLNLLDPDSGRLTFANDSGGNHTASGWTAASTSYANTAIAASSVFTSTSCYLTVYVRNNSSITGAQQDMGTFNGSTLGTIIGGNYGGTAYFFGGDSSGSLLTAGDSNSSGLLAGLRTETAMTLYRNGTQFGSKTATTSPSPIVRDIYIGAANNAAGVTPTGRQYAYAQMGLALSGSQSTFYTIIQNFQTILGRQV